MAEVSYLHLLETVDDFDFEQEEILAIDSVYPYCSHLFCTDSDPISLNDHHIHHSGDFCTETFDQIGGLSIGASGSDSFEEIPDRENQVIYVMDLIRQRVEQSRSLEIGSFELDPNDESSFGIVEINTEEIGGNSLELGLDTEFDRIKDLGYGDEEDDNFGGFIVSDCGHEFYVSRRGSGNGSGGSSNGGQGKDVIERFSGGLNVVRFESDSEEDVSELLVRELHLEDDYASASRNDDGNFTLCWDSLQLEDHRDGNDDFEWEEVDNGLELLISEEPISILPIIGPEEDEVEEIQQGRSRNHEWEEVDNGLELLISEEPISVLPIIGPEEDEVEEIQQGRSRNHEWEEVDNGLELLISEEPISVLPIIGPEEDEVEEIQQGRSRNHEWEVLLNVNNLERNPTVESNEALHLGENDGFIYTANDEVTFAQFAEAEDFSMGRPPASRLVVERLPWLIMKESDVQNDNSLCAVCKDEMGHGEQVKQLPCSHCYHGDCIFPWLEISNTCPVCRHELPTDDPDYEQRQMQRAARDQSQTD